jgi:hypothetical protein
MPATATTINPKHQALEVAVQLYTAAFGFGEDEVAWQYLSIRCQEQTTFADFSAIVQSARLLYPDMRATNIGGTVYEDYALVNYTATGLANYTAQRWTIYPTGWKWDAC